MAALTQLGNRTPRACLTSETGIEITSEHRPEKDFIMKEQAEDLANAVKIRENPPTQRYLTLKNYDQLERTGLMRVLAYVIHTVIFNRMTWKDNPAIVICTSELEEVVGCRIFFFPQLSHLMKKDLTPDPDHIQIPVVWKSPVAKDKCVFFPNSYHLHFLKIVYKVSPGQTAFTLNQVSNAVYKYVSKRKKKMCFKENPQIMVVDALLSKTIRTSCFHLSQLPKLTSHRSTQVWQWQVNCSKYKHRKTQSHLIGTAVYVGILVAILRIRFIPKTNEEERAGVMRLYNNVMSLCKSIWTSSGQAADASPVPEFGPALIEAYTNGAIPDPSSKKLSVYERAWNVGKQRGVKRPWAKT